MPISSNIVACPLCRNEAHDDGHQLGGYRILCCSQCGVRFAPEAFSVTVDYDEVYDSEEYYATQVQSLRRTKDCRRFARSLTYQPFFRRVRCVPGARLLDIGCGVGRFCLAADAYGWDVTGIDISTRAIGIARQVATFPVLHCDVNELIARQEVFDAVTAFEVLEHTSAPVNFLSRLKRILRPDGEVVCTVPNWDCPVVQTAERKDWLPPIHLLFFTQPALATAASIAGFTEIVTGVIWSDPFPSGLRQSLRLPRWVLRRIRHRPNEPVGLWLHARSARKEQPEGGA